MGITRLSSIKINNRGSVVTQTLQQLLTSVPPWAKYRGASYSNSILPDESGNGRNAVCTSCTLSNTTGNGAGTVPLPICKGTSTVKGNSTILFPVGSIPQNYTIAFICRYSGGSTNRILCGYAGQNYILGHHSAKQGVLYDGTQWDTATLNGKEVNNVSGNISDWLSMCVSSGGAAAPNNIIVNGVSKGTSSITVNSTINQLCINLSSYQEYSSFELAQLIIFDSPLTSTQIKVITDSFSNYLITGVLA
jgi:hypothetical protein